jgi:hypothetical protein
MCFGISSYWHVPWTNSTIINNINSSNFNHCGLLLHKKWNEMQVAAFLYYIYTVYRKRVLPNFCINFLKSRQILSMMNENWICDKSRITCLLQLVWKKIHNCHISDILILHNLAQFKFDEKGNVTIQQVIDIFTFFARTVPLWPPHRSSKTTKCWKSVDMWLDSRYSSALLFDIYCPYNGFSCCYVFRVLQ